MTCGSGNEFRTRICLSSDGVEVSGCPGSATDTVRCILGSCPTWSAWSEYGECDAVCGGGNAVSYLYVTKRLVKV